MENIIDIEFRSKKQIAAEKIYDSLRKEGAISFVAYDGSLHTTSVNELVYLIKCEKIQYRKTSEDLGEIYHHEGAGYLTFYEKSADIVATLFKVKSMLKDVNVCDVSKIDCKGDLEIAAFNNFISK